MCMVKIKHSIVIAERAFWSRVYKRSVTVVYEKIMVKRGDNNFKSFSFLSFTGTSRRK